MEYIIWLGKGYYLNPSLKPTRDRSKAWKLSQEGAKDALKYALVNHKKALVESF